MSLHKVRKSGTTVGSVSDSVDDCPIEVPTISAGQMWGAEVSSARPWGLESLLEASEIAVVKPEETGVELRVESKESVRKTGQTGSEEQGAESQAGESKDKGEETSLIGGKANRFGKVGGRVGVKTPVTEIKLLLLLK